METAAQHCQLRFVLSYCFVASIQIQMTIYLNLALNFLQSPGPRPQNESMERTSDEKSSSTPSTEVCFVLLFCS